VLLVRNETSPEDLRGMIAAEGILTAKGGVSSHAALVARQMGKVCICGASALHIDYTKKTVSVAGQVFREGDFLSIDGTSGTVYAGQLPTSPSEIITGMIHGDKRAQKTEKFQAFNQLMKWCSQATRLEVRTNADNPEQTENALAFGATGIGLTRTEHMFFEGDRIDAMREMILADKTDDRIAALRKLLPYQRADFTGIFKALKGYPATIGLLDPPLHEFLPHDHASQQSLAEKTGIDAAKIAQRVKDLHEFNPMLGHRGCRLGIAYPEITEMQARAIFEAAADVAKKKIKVKPEVMIPLVGFKKELDLQVEIVHRVAKEVMAEKKVKFDYLVGTMIEVPRGALTADEIAQTAEFFSFGTNDLTQTALGISRDDMGNFLMPYTENEIFKKNPFATLDQTGVGQLMQIAVDKGRSSRPGIKLGICGEHGGDPDSVKFCHRPRPELRELLTLPRTRRPPRRCAGRDRGKARREEEVTAAERTHQTAASVKAGAAFYWGDGTRIAASAHRFSDLQPPMPSRPASPHPSKRKSGPGELPGPLSSYGKCLSSLLMMFVERFPVGRSAPQRGRFTLRQTFWKNLAIAAKNLPSATLFPAHPARPLSASTRHRDWRKSALCSKPARPRSFATQVELAVALLS
jgi:phosphohistidine swiveling domain-containing protein